MAIGTCALLLAWNEYPYAFLFLPSEAKLTVPFILGHFTTSDDAPWTLMMAPTRIYSMPPITLYYSGRRFMATGLTAGSVKSEKNISDFCCRFLKGGVRAVFRYNPQGLEGQASGF